MATIYANFVAGLVDDNPLASGATTLTSSGLASLPTVAAPNTMWITLDPDAVGGAPEIVQVTVHTASATTATIVRAQQSTTARAHNQNTKWTTGFTKSDADELPFRKLTTTGDTLYASAANTASRLAIGAADQVLRVVSGVPAWGYPRLPVCQAHDASQSITDNTITAITFDSVDDLDPLGWHDLVTNPSRITPTIAGWYRAYGRSKFTAAQTTIARMAIGTRLNGTTTLNGGILDQFLPSTLSIEWPMSTVSNLVQLNGTTDYLELMVFQDDTGGTARLMESWFTVELVYPT